MRKLDLHNIKIRENSWIAKLAAKKLHSPAGAIVIGKTIHLYNATRQDFLQNERWLKHEICHLRQFHKYGFIVFCLKYLWEGLKKGYQKNKFEVAAREAEYLQYPFDPIKIKMMFHGIKSF